MSKREDEVVYSTDRCMPSLYSAGDAYILPPFKKRSDYEKLIICTSENSIILLVHSQEEGLLELGSKQVEYLF